MDRIVSALVVLVAVPAFFADATHVAENAALPDGTIGTLRVHVVALLVKQGKGWVFAEARPYLFLPPPVVGQNSIR